MATGKEISRLLAALTAAALVGTLALTVGLLTTYAIITPSHFSYTDITASLYIWFVAALIGVPVALLGGAPVYLFLRNFGILNGFSSIAAGTALGFLVSLAGISGLPWEACCATGAGSALMAWITLRHPNHPARRVR